MRRRLVVAATIVAITGSACESTFDKAARKQRARAEAVAATKLNIKANAAVDLIRLRNGSLMLVYNDSMSDRTPLMVAHSPDSGQTWPATARRAIATGKDSFAYPVALQTRDGKVHLI